jgi:type I restriction-modification system DNA methylase subunit/REP element-mobilizing transposase RayT
MEEAKTEIAKLVEDFDRKISIIKKGDSYKEANVEDEFIKPLFKYLNWNISNEGIKNIADREFIVQAKGKGGKEPDYLLQLDGKPCFYMEAKHPKYDLFKEIKYIWQTYSYAYSTQSSSVRNKVDFALLTDFEEFRFFDCTFKADPHTVNNFNVIDWKYTDYVDKFDELWRYFEKENVRKGSLESLYLEEKKIKENRIPPDKAFLDDLDNEKTGWRITLAKDIKKYNSDLSSDFITSVIQLIIDRFVFIKVLSDREIEDDFLAQVIEQIDKASLKSEEGIINETCKDLFARMNKTYNGSIFEDRKELDAVRLSNKTLHLILKSLLPENSRYNFKVIPVEILGTIYEQFLGKIVTTTDKRATIEYKPEVRKAGGVYYTPQYIVEYIVENTVGTKLAKCKNINDVMGLKICDPACGSGSFLLGAYDRLINHVIHYFTVKAGQGKDITKKERELFYHDNDGNIRLTAKIKRDILRNCIFGVDIDPQAVEVTKMSLSLKALEYTRHDELYNEVNLFHEKVLPDLSGNIKCGNSLIGSDFFAPGLFPDIEEAKKINAFDWEKEFPEVLGKKELSKFHLITFETKYSRISNNNEPVLLDDEGAKLILECFKESKEKLGIKILACSILIDHVHVVIADMGNDISKIVNHLKGYSSFMLNRTLSLNRTLKGTVQREGTVQGEGRQMHLWAKSFNDSFLEDEKHLFNAIEYVNNNPLKHPDKTLGNDTNKLIQTIVEPFTKWDNYEYNTGGDAQGGASPDCITDDKSSRGFDCVIGNPPYVFTRDVDWGEEAKIYYWEKFNITKDDNSRKNQSGKINLYILFLLKATKIINSNGFVSFIIPNGLLRTTTYDTTRAYLIKNTSILEIVDLKEGVFEGVTAPTIIINLGKYKNNNKIKIIDANYKNDNCINLNKINYISQDNIINNVSYAISLFVSDDESEIFGKMNKNSTYLKNITKDIIEGIVASKDYIFKEKINEKCKPFLEGKDIKRYLINFNSRYILFDRNKLHRARPDYVWESSKKIIIQRISGGSRPLVCTIDTEKYYTFASTNLLLIKEEYINNYSYELICGLLNSKLINFYYTKNFTNSSNLTVNISKTFLDEIPLPKINDSNKQSHDLLVSLVDQMLEAQKEYHAKKDTTDEYTCRIMQQRIDNIDKQIDDLVYRLYGLTDDEIKIIEGER